MVLNYLKGNFSDFFSTLFNTALSAGIEPRAVRTSALAVRRSNLSARTHSLWLDLIHYRLDLIH
jgi:hypothetical protein